MSIIIRPLASKFDVVKWIGKISSLETFSCRVFLDKNALANNCSLAYIVEDGSRHGGRSLSKVFAKFYTFNV